MQSEGPVQARFRDRARRGIGLMLCQPAVNEDFVRSASAPRNSSRRPPSIRLALAEYVNAILHFIEEFGQLRMAQGFA